MGKNRYRFWLFALVVLLLLSSGWRNPATAYAGERSEPASQPANETDPVSLGSLPPLPYLKATMDLPRLRQEREAAIAASERKIDGLAGVAVTRNGETGLELDVTLARANGDKWIEVDLSEQKTYAWIGNELQNEFIISSGVEGYETVEGVFRMWVRVPEQTMSGGDRASGDYYNLPNVPWVQYFYQDYAFHGTYWHNNFGTPMSHGCINLTIEDAKWLFDWAMPEWDGQMDWMRSTEENATLVWVHQ